MDGLIPEEFKVVIRIDNYSLIAIGLLGVGFIIMSRIR